MPIIKSAKKALRASKVKRAFNLKRKNTITKVVKSLKKLVSEKKLDEAKKLFPQVQKALDKAVKTKYIKANNASRKKSRLAALLKRSK